MRPKNEISQSVREYPSPSSQFRADKWLREPDELRNAIRPTASNPGGNCSRQLSGKWSRPNHSQAVALQLFTMFLSMKILRLPK